MQDDLKYSTRYVDVYVRTAAASPSRLVTETLLVMHDKSSLVLGTLALTHAHGAVRITAIAVFAASVSAMFGTDWTTP